MNRGMRWPLGVAVGFLAARRRWSIVHSLPLGALQPRLSALPDHHGAARGAGRRPQALAPFQLVKRIRSRHLRYHRRAGRALVAVGLVVGVTALCLWFVIPFSGWGERVVIGLFGGLFLVALVKGFVHVRAGRVTLHQEWMIQAFAIALAIAMTCLISIPAALLIVGTPTDGRPRRL